MSMLLRMEAMRKKQASIDDLNENCQTIFSSPVVETRIDSLSPDLERQVTLQIWTPESQIWV